MGEIDSNYNISVIADNDFAFNVHFSFDGKLALFESDDTAEMLIHGDDGDIIISAVKFENNIASFYLPCEVTQSLLRDGEDESYYEYCISAKWTSRGKHTPIHRKSLTVKRC